LGEFDRSGLSAKQFSKLVGVKYSTFGYWLQCRKRRSGSARPASVAGGQQQVAWLEAVVQEGAPLATSKLVLELPGGVRTEVVSPQQIHLAAVLVRALEKPC